MGIIVVVFSEVCFGSVTYGVESILAALYCARYGFNSICDTAKAHFGKNYNNNELHQTQEPTDATDLKVDTRQESHGELPTKEIPNHAQSLKNTSKENPGRPRIRRKM